MSYMFYLSSFSGDLCLWELQNRIIDQTSMFNGSPLVGVAYGCRACAHDKFYNSSTGTCELCSACGAQEVETAACSSMTDTVCETTTPEPCEAGTYKSEPWAPECNYCEPGMVSGPAATHCTACPADSFAVGGMCLCTIPPWLTITMTECDTASCPGGVLSPSRGAKFCE
eukprot:1813496-Rhodomonas_salina.2